MICKKSLPLLLFLMFFIGACQKDELAKEVPFDAIEGVHYEIYDLVGKSTTTERLKIVTFNTASASKSELQTLLGLLPSGTNVVCLQEVKNPNDVLEVFSSGPNHRNEGSYHSFPYFSKIKKEATKFWVNKEDYQMIVSKFPIVKHDFKQVTTDPHGDKWERFGEYVRLKVNSNTSIDLFNYHNTNRLDGVDKAEAGMRAFRNWINQVLGVGSGHDLKTLDNLFIAGDFNLSEHGTQYNTLKSILGTRLYYARDNLDYIASSEPRRSSGEIDGGSISDHDIVWATYYISTNRNNALNNVARVYENSGFGGRVAAFEKGDYYFLPYTYKVQGDDRYWNDRISSIRVGTGVKLEAYQHSSYRGFVYYLPYQSGSHGFANDDFSSIKVKAR